MGFDDLFGNRQTKARVIAEVAFGAIRVEAFEHLGQRLFGDARPGIFDHDQHAVFTPARPDPHRIAVFAEGNRIGDQVDENLRKAALQPVNFDHVGREIGNEFNTFFARLIAEIIGQVGEGFHQIEFFFFFFDQFAV